MVDHELGERLVPEALLVAQVAAHGEGVDDLAVVERGGKGAVEGRARLVRAVQLQRRVDRRRAQTHQRQTRQVHKELRRRRRRRRLLAQQMRSQPGQTQSHAVARAAHPHRVDTTTAAGTATATVAAGHGHGHVAALARRHLHVVRQGDEGGGGRARNGLGRVRIGESTRVVAGHLGAVLALKRRAARRSGSGGGSGAREIFRAFLCLVDHLRIDAPEHQEVHFHLRLGLGLGLVLGRGASLADQVEGAEEDLCGVEVAPQFQRPGRQSQDAARMARIDGKRRAQAQLRRLRVLQPQLETREVVPMLRSLARAHTAAACRAVACAVFQ